MAQNVRIIVALLEDMVRVPISTSVTSGYSMPFSGLNGAIHAGGEGTYVQEKHSFTLNL